MNIIQKPSPNFDSRNGLAPKYIVLHIMSGTLAGTDAWFAQSVAQVSAHYGIGLTGEVHQYVDENNSAWANGVVKNPTAQIVISNSTLSQNKISLSIEHEGNDLSLAPESQLSISVALILELALKWNIPIDRQHILGHYEIDSIDKPNCPSVNKAIMDTIVKRVRTAQATSLLTQALGYLV